MDRFFTWFAGRISFVAGQPLAFVLAFGTIIVWAVTGPLFGFSDTWQLVINTGTTIVTFLMVFLIQNSTNRDAAAMQAKLDELLRAVEKARRRVHRHRASDRKPDRGDPRGAGEGSGGEERTIKRPRSTLENLLKRRLSRESREWADSAGAGEGNRTLVVSLGSFCSAIELHPLRGADATSARRGSTAAAVAQVARR